MKMVFLPEWTWVQSVLPGFCIHWYCVSGKLTHFKINLPGWDAYTAFVSSVSLINPPTSPLMPLTQPDTHAHTHTYTCIPAWVSGELCHETREKLRPPLLSFWWPLNKAILKHIMLSDFIWCLWLNQHVIADLIRSACLHSPFRHAGSLK